MPVPDHHPVERKPVKLSQKARWLLEDVVVKQGLSYVDAICELERRGERVHAPYRQAAGELQRWLDEHP